MRFSRFYKYFCQQKVSVVLRKITEGYVCIVTSAVPSRSSRYICFSAVGELIDVYRVY